MKLVEKRNGVKIQEIGKDLSGQFVDQYLMVERLLLDSPPVSHILSSSVLCPKDSTIRQQTVNENKGDSSSQRTQRTRDNRQANKSPTTIRICPLQQTLELQTLIGEFLSDVTNQQSLGEDSEDRLHLSSTKPQEPLSCKGQTIYEKSIEEGQSKGNLKVGKINLKVQSQKRNKQGNTPITKDQPINKKASHQTDSKISFRKIDLKCLHENRQEDSTRKYDPKYGIKAQRIRIRKERVSAGHFGSQKQHCQKSSLMKLSVIVAETNEVDERENLEQQPKKVGEDIKTIPVTEPTTMIKRAMPTNKSVTRSALKSIPEPVTKPVPSGVTMHLKGSQCQNSTQCPSRPLRIQIVIPLQDRQGGGCIELADKQFIQQIRSDIKSLLGRMAEEVTKHQ